MRRVAAVLTLLLARGALAQETPAAPPPAPTPPAEPSPSDPPPEEPQPGSLGELFLGGGSIEELGIGFFLGVAACRSGSWGAADPELRAVTISGELLESEAHLRAMVDAAVPWNKKGRPYTEETCRELRRVLERLRYHAELGERAVANGVELDLRLRPVTLVRYIDVRGNLTLWEGLLGLVRLQFSPIFREDIERRLRLRPGASIEDDPERRKEQLGEEAQRVTEYLARRGYFDAEVEVTARPLGGAHEVAVVVRIDKGPAYTVGEVKVEGNRAVEDGRIIDAMAQRVCPFVGLCLRKARFDFDELKEDRDRVLQIYQRRGYPGARVTTDFDPAKSPDPATQTVGLTVSVAERKKITVAFVGHRTRDERGLRTLLTFAEAGAYDDYEAQRSAEAIRRSYQGSGRFLTTVRFERERIEPSLACPECPPHDRLVFQIDEGPEQRIRAITFEGNRTFSEARLREDAVRTREFPRFEYLFAGGGYVTSLQLQQDVERIEELYREEGFPEVRAEAQLGNSPGVFELGAVAAQVTAEDAGRGLYIRFVIDEGRRDVAREVSYRGSHAIPAAELAQGAALRAGQPFTPAALESDVERLRRLYFSRGYLHVKLRPERTGEAADTRVTFHIDEGLRVRAGKVVVRGNFKTRRWVIHDALDLDEGEVLSVSRLEASQARLRATDLFASVRAPEPIGTDPVNLIIDVEERFDNIFDAEASFGFSTDNNLFVGFALGLRNLAGIGVSFTVNGEAGLQRQRGQANLAFPQWVMRRAVRLPLKLDLTARAALEDTPRFGPLSTIGFGASLSRQLGTGILFSLRYDWNRFGRSTELVRSPGADQDLRTIPISTTTASVGPLLLIDRRRPTALMPTSGYIAQGSVGVASRYLGGTDDFVKLGLGGQLFLPLGSRLVLANTVRYDQGFPLAGEVLLPEVERFTAGGDTTVRGIEEDRLATEIIANDLSGAGDVTSFRVVPAGGNIRFLHKLDLQVRLIGDSFAIASAIFLDSGFIANSFQRFDVRRRFRHSVGVALARLVTPAGSLSIEYAIPLDPDVGDDPTGRLHVNVGFAF
jgi:outer membrane protein assembly complex protein YaeT